MAFGIFEQIAGVLAICVAAGALALLLRQPLIVGLLAAGIISTLRTREANLQLISSLRHHGFSGGIAVAAEDLDVSDELEAAGAELTIQPLHVAARPLLTTIHERDGGTDAGGCTTRSLAVKCMPVCL